MPRPPTRVLVVDDEQDQFAVARNMARSAAGDACSFDWAPSYDEGLRIALERRHDLILLDINLGGRSGIELLREMRSRGVDVPVIALTAQADQKTDEDALGAGAIDYLVKGYVTPAGLDRAIRHAVDRHRAQQAMRENLALTRAVLNSLSAHIAVLDEQGRILSVNNAWQQFARENGAPSLAAVGVGADYLAAVEAAAGHSEAAREAAAGIRSVLAGRSRSFELEYDCHSPTQKRWFQMVATPLEDGRGAAISHINITARVETERQQGLLNEGLRRLIDAADELIRCRTLDDVYRCAVDAARQKLGIERCAIFLHDNGWVCGTFGTDMKGRTTDERRSRFPADEGWIQAFSAKSVGAVWHVEKDGIRYDWNGEAGEPIGRGWVATTPIARYGIAPMGMFVNDAAITGAEFDPLRQNLLAALASFLADVIESKRAQQSVEAGKRQIEAVIHNIPDIAWMKDTEGLFVVVNGAFAAACARKLEDIPGLTDLDLWPADLAEAYRRDDRDVMASRQRKVIEEQLGESSGRRIWIETIKSPIVGDEGEVLGTAGIARDVTQRRRAEDLLRESEAKFRMLFTEMRTAATLQEVVFDAAGRAVDTRFLEVNPAFERLVRKSKNELVGRLGTDVFAGADTAWWVAMLGRVATTGEPVNVERYEPRDDAHLFIHAYRPKPGQVATLIRDVTEHRRAERALQESEERYRLHFENVQDIVFSLDRDGRITAVSPSVRSVLGYEPSELIGRRLGETPLLGEEALSLARANIARVLAGERVEASYSVVNKAGGAVVMEISASPLQKAGVVEGVLGVARDVTRRKKAEDELLALNDTLEQRVAERTKAIEEVNRRLRAEVTERQRAQQALERAKEAAEAASRAKSQFLAGMSHELRTPLNAIIGFAQLLGGLSFGELNDRQRRYVNNIETSGHHLLQLINDILDLSKVEAGRLRLTPHPVHPSKLLRDAHVFVATAAMKKNIALNADFPGDLPAIKADEGRLKQVLYNLLSNAIKFTRDGGQITTRASVVQDASLGTDGRARTCLRVAVVDNGIGIKPEDHDRVFDEFVQLDASYAREQEGTGLGLSLVRRLVALHGGRVWVESAGVEGQGSSFVFLLPVEGPDIEPFDEGSDTRKVPKARPTVLLVDDDGREVSLVTRALQKDGYRVLQATSALSAVSQALVFRPQAIVTDLRMPGISGFELVQELASLEKTSAIPVVVYTGMTMTPQERQKLGHKVQAVVIKPDVHSLLVEISVRIRQENAS
jgi:PAS domain S-box-containing protein